MSTVSSNPYTLNGYQKDLVQGYSPKSVFGVGCPNPTSTVSGVSVPCYMSTIGYATDANDRIPKDNIVEKPGYYIVVIGGNKQRVFYTGTDAIYKKKYIHTY